MAVNKEQKTRYSARHLVTFQFLGYILGLGVSSCTRGRNEWVSRTNEVRDRNTVWLQQAGGPN